MEEADTTERVASLSCKPFNFSTATAIHEEVLVVVIGSVVAVVLIVWDTTVLVVVLRC